MKKNYVGRACKAEICAYDDDHITENWVPMGFYHVVENGQEIDEVKKLVKLTAYDSVKKLDVQFEKIGLPITGLELEKIILERNNLSLSDGSFSLPLANHTFTTLNIGEGTEIFDREVLQDYYRLNMASASLDRNGAISVRSVFTEQTLNDNISFEYDATEFKSDSIQGPINALVYGNKAEGTDESYQDIFVRDEHSIEKKGLTELKFYNNLFLDLLPRDEQQKIIEKIFPVINGFTYAPFNIQMFARPDFDPLDMIPLKDSEGKIIPIPLSNFSFKYNGGLLGTIKTTIIPETLTDYDRGGLGRRLRKLWTEAKILVDQVENKITLIVQKQETQETTLEEHSASLVLLDNKLQTEISERITDGENLREELSSSLTQLSDSFTLEFTRITGEVDAVTGDLEQLKTYYRFTENGAIIGKNNSPFQLSISNKEIQFLENDSAIAYVNGRKMYIESLEVLQQIIMGYHLIEKYDGAHKGTLVRMI